MGKKKHWEPDHYQPPPTPEEQSMASLFPTPRAEPPPVGHVELVDNETDGTEDDPVESILDTLDFTVDTNDNDDELGDAPTERLQIPERAESLTPSEPPTAAVGEKRAVLPDWAFGLTSDSIAPTVEPTPNPPTESTGVPKPEKSNAPVSPAATGKRRKVVEFKPRDRAALDAAKQSLEPYLSSLGLDPSKNMHCLRRGHADVHPSMSFFVGNDGIPRVKCRGCGWGGTIIDVIMEVYGVDQTEAIKRAIAFAGTGYLQPKAPKAKPVDLDSVHEVIESAAAHFDDPDCREYLARRGFIDSDLPTLRRFGVGFDPIHRTLVIPHGNDYYTARRIDNVDKAKRFMFNAKASVELFNPEALGNDIVAITEGAIDALSLICSGVPTVALGGAGTQRTLLAAIKESKARVCMLCFDNDAAGTAAAQKLAAELDALGKATLRVTPPADVHDFNDAFRAERSALAEYMKLTLTTAESLLPRLGLPTTPFGDPVGCVATLDRFADHGDFSAAAVFDPDVITAAAACKLDYSEYYDAFRRLCKFHAVDLALFNDKVKTQCNTLKKKRGVTKTDEHGNTASLNNCLVMPDGSEFIPELGDCTGKLRVDMQGLHAKVHVGFGNYNWKLVSYSAPIISALVKNIDTGMVKKRLAFFDPADNHWIFLPAVDNAVLASSTKALELGNYGLDVRTTNVKYIIDYLAAYFNFNRDEIPVEHTVSRVGWRDDGAFVYPNTDGAKYQLDSSSSSFVDKVFQIKGDRAVVEKLLRRLQDNDIAQFVIGAVLAAPLVYILGRQNISVHIYANTGSGKSSIAKLAVSLVINPNAPGAMPTADATKVGLEQYFALHYDFVSVVEDIDTVNDDFTQRIIAQIAYQFGNNTGRLRGKKDGGLQELKEFRGSLITNGERPLTSDSSKGGAKRRQIEIKAPDQIVDTAFAQEIHRTTHEHYGLFGRDWIAAIIRLGDDPVKVTFNRLGDQLYKQFPSKVPLHIDSVAAIATANILFRVHVLGESEAEVESAERARAARIMEQLPDESAIADWQRAASFIRDLIHSHAAYFECSTSVVPGDDRKPFNTYGVRRAEAICFYPSVLKKKLTDAGFAAESIVRQLADHGFLVRAKDGKVAAPVKIHGRTARMYQIPWVQLDEHTPDEEPTPVDDDDIPF